MSDLNATAFPLPDIYHPNGEIEYGSSGLTKREYAAIHLRVPKSGNEELDEMIREAQRNEMAARAMHGLLAGPRDRPDGQNMTEEWASEASYIIADAMLKEGGK